MTHTTEASQHNVYVIELDKEVLKFDEFVKANPQYKEGLAEISRSGVLV